MQIEANAKINLCLDVLGKREDGYHDVCMILQEIQLCDIVDIELKGDGEISLESEGFVFDDIRSNLAYRAARLFFDTLKSSLGCHISLKKNIPVSAGLAGGSADCAAVLKGLNMLMGSPFDKEKLKKLGATLGADVPFCIEGGTCLGEGTGTTLTPICGMPQMWVVLIKPNMSVSTKEAYEKADSVPYSHPDVKKAAECIQAGDMESLFACCANAFEMVLGDKKKEIDKIKDYLYSKGALFSMMSGSGPTVFALFDDEDKAKAAVCDTDFDIESSHLTKTV